ncbi:chemotaxis response regulator protein-glutamate methylesterase [Candidatus Kapabacteria bacterium]|nr:chemotaxis response regulator protein-glutamate methylesterase [Candidatus Kapabacteria bacterium]
MEKIKLLIVEDSAFLRSTYQKLLSDSKEIEIVDTAKNGKDGVEKTILHKPDVITMDIEMPVMNGLDAVKEIMKVQPTPILMVSSLTKEGADATMEALSRGAIDFIPKETAFSKVSTMKDNLIEKIVKIAGNTGLKNRILRTTNITKENRNHDSIDNNVKKTVASESNSVKKGKSSNYNLAEREIPTKSKINAISIGISTGGPLSLQQVIPFLSENIKVPVFIVQHMPPNFTKSLAERLDGTSKLKVKEAESGEIIEGGTVYIAPGGKQMLIGNSKIVITDKKPEKELYSPSFNIALGSQVHCYNKKILAVVMTGMGSDGTIAMKKLQEIGGYNISQDPDTCVVAGMPSSALNAGIINEMLPLDKIAPFINKIFD